MAAVALMELISIVAPGVAVPTPVVPETAFSDLIDANFAAPVPAIQPKLTNEPATLPTDRFNRLVAGAFHPRTAFQKADIASAPIPVTEVSPEIAANAQIPTRAASSILLALLGETGPAEPEPDTSAEPAQQPVNVSIAAPPPLVAVAPEKLSAPLIETQAATQQPAQDAVQVARAEPVSIDKPTEKISPTKAEVTPEKSRDAAAPVPKSPDFQQATAPAPQQTSAASDVTAPQQQRQHTAPLAQVPHVVAIEARKLDAGGTREFTIRLDPANLGRIDVRLEMKPDGYVTAVVQADQASTYDLLRQDARGFEQSLTSAGLKTHADSLNFSLAQENSSFAQLMSGDKNHGQHQRTNKFTGDDEASPAEMPAFKNHRLTLTQIDVMA